MSTKTRIGHGIRLLNKRYPGWIEKINLKKFDFSDCLNCVLGQVFDYYWQGTQKLNIYNPVDYGFAWLTWEDCKELQQEWMVALSLLKNGENYV